MPMQSHPRRVARWIGLAAACAALLLSAPHGRATEIVLKSGARIDADILLQNDERVVLDLGFEVLSVPADQIASQGESAPQTASVPDEAPEESVEKPAEPARESRAAGSFRDNVEALEGAVVVVSNPGGFGAGFLIDKSGLLLTNYHVVRGEKDNDVTIFLNRENGKKEKKVFRKVEVRAFSSLLDCALLKIGEKDLKGIDLPVLDLAESDSLRTSMRVYAIGNPGVGSKMLEHSVSQGILSSTSRNFNDIVYLQTTAAVNPGNSGGPLLNDRGEVVGLVTFRAIWQEGLAFALPVWYMQHFIANAEAYAPTQDNKNTGYRYHDPSEWLVENQKKDPTEEKATKGKD